MNCEEAVRRYLALRNKAENVRNGANQHIQPHEDIEVNWANVEVVFPWAVVLQKDKRESNNEYGEDEIEYRPKVDCDEHEWGTEEGELHRKSYIRSQPVDELLQ